MLLTQLLQYKKAKQIVNKIYLFGSFLTSDNYNDIDIIIVHDNASFTELKIIKKEMLAFVSDVCGQYADITIFSQKELEESRFLEKIGKYLEINNNS